MAFEPETSDPFRTNFELRWTQLWTLLSFWCCKIKSILAQNLLLVFWKLQLQVLKPHVVVCEHLNLPILQINIALHPAQEEPKLTVKIRSTSLQCLSNKCFDCTQFVEVIWYVFLSVCYSVLYFCPTMVYHLHWIQDFSIRVGRIQSHLTSFWCLYLHNYSTNTCCLHLIWTEIGFLHKWQVSQSCSFGDITLENWQVKSLFCLLSGWPKEEEKHLGFLSSCDVGCQLNRGHCAKDLRLPINKLALHLLVAWSKLEKDRRRKASNTYKMWPTLT